MIRPEEGIVRIGGDRRAEHARSKLNRSEIDGGEFDGGKVDDEVGKKNQKTSKYKYLFKFKKLFNSKKILRSEFFTPRARLAFTKFRQAFVKALIFYHFDPKCYIRVETDASSYIIGRVLSQLTLDNLG